MARATWLALLATTAILAGCMNGPTPNGPTTSNTTSNSPGPSGPQVDSFDAVGEGMVPNGWQTYGGTWGRISNATGASHSAVMKGAGSDALNSLVATTTYTDFEAEVDFAMRSGEHPQGAGLVFHFKDKDNYQIIRYSISENGWHLFTVHEGTREKRDMATLPNGTAPTFHVWVHLKVVSRGGRVEAFDGSTRVLDYQLPTEMSQSGKVGLFVRGNTVAEFDNLRTQST